MPRLARRPSLMDQPEDILHLCVRTLSLSATRPEWVAALCTCNSQLRALLPSDLRSNYLDHRLQKRPSTATVRALGVLKVPRRTTIEFKLSCRWPLVGRLDGVHRQRNECLPQGEPGESLLVIEARASLQKALLTSAVSNRLRTRPEAASLLERGVLKAEPSTGALVSSRKADLQKALVTSAVSNRLRVRPEPASLLERGVLKAEPGVSPSLIQARDRLQKELIKQTIKRSLAVQQPARERAETC